MNILIFSPVRIYPADAGSRIRILNFTKYLIQKGHNVHFVYYTDDGISKIHFEYMLDICDTFSVVPREKKFKRKTGNYILDEVYEDNIHKKVLELVDIFSIDTVLMNYLFYSKVFDYLPENIHKIIDTHDKFTDRYKIFKDFSEVNYDWHSYSKSDETRALNRANTILAITDEENKYFSSICNEKIEVLTIGHIEEKKYLEKKYNKLKSIGFIGGANKVNIAAINRFLEVFYYIFNDKNEIDIVIAGQICNHINIKKPQIKLLGLINNVEDFYNSVDLIINPLTFGTGQKIKSVEAISYGLPIISTKVGFEGIESDNKFHQFNSLEEMIKSIELLMYDNETFSDLAIDSRKIFDNYCNILEKNLNYIFNKNNNDNINYKVLLQHKSKIQKETYNVLINTYLEASKRRNNKIKEQEKQIEKLEKQIEKQIVLIDKYHNLINAIKDLTKISIFKNPIRKYKLYKKVLIVFYSK